MLPDLPKANYKVWVRGYGLVDSPKVDAEPGKQLDLTAVPAPSVAVAAQYYPAIYWYLDAQDSRRRSVRRQERIAAERRRSRIGSPTSRTAAASAVTSSASRRRGRSRPPWPITIRRRGLDPPHPVGPGGAADGRRDRRPTRRRRRCNTSRDWTDRIAKGELPNATPPRPQGVERNIVITEWEWGNAKQLSPRSDLDRQAQSDGQRLRPALRLDRIFDRRAADARSEDQHGQRLQSAGARCRYARSARARGMRRSRSRMQPSAYWGDREDLGTKSTITTPCSTRRAGCG